MLQTHRDFAQQLQSQHMLDEAGPAAHHYTLQHWVYPALIVRVRHLHDIGLTAGIA